MAGLVDSKESEVLNSLVFTEVLPFDVRSLLELRLVLPFEFIRPFLTTSVGLIDCKKKLIE